MACSLFVLLSRCNLGCTFPGPVYKLYHRVNNFPCSAVVMALGRVKKEGGEGEGGEDERIWTKR